MLVVNPEKQQPRLYAIRDLRPGQCVTHSCVRKLGVVAKVAGRGKTVVYLVDGSETAEEDGAAIWYETPARVVLE